MKASEQWSKWQSLPIRLDFQNWRNVGCVAFQRTQPIEGLALLCPPYEGGHRGDFGILNTPCRKTRRPRCQGDKTSS